MTFGLSAGAIALATTAVTVGTSIYSANAAGKSAAKTAGAASRAEGEAIAKERLNTTIRNAYSTSFAQMQLGLKKRQLAQQGAGIRAATLAAQGDVTVAAGSTYSIGASTESIAADIDMKSQQALDTTTDQYENEVLNYNNDLSLMVINTQQTAPTPTKYEYQGPSSGAIVAGALVQGFAQFASGYAARKATLGLGPKVPSTSAGLGLTTQQSYSAGLIGR